MLFSEVVGVAEALSLLTCAMTDREDRGRGYVYDNSIMREVSRSNLKCMSMTFLIELVSEL